MKAIVCKKETGLVFKDVPKPVPEPDQVLIKLAHTGFCGSDHTMVENLMMPGGFTMPDDFILGHEVSGTVEDAGSKCENVTIGERVILRPNECGKCAECLADRPALCRTDRRTVGVGDLPGGFAEYLVAYPNMLIPVPAGVDSKNAALAEMFATSLHALNSTGVRGKTALVMGGGPIGLAMVQLLKVRGFETVVLSEPVEDKRKLSREFGAQTVLNPLEEDIQEISNDITGGIGFDVVFECAGVAGNVQVGIDCVRSLGVVSVVGVSLSDIVIRPMSINVYKEIKIAGSYASSQAENRQCLEWMADGSIDGRPMISDVIALEDLPRIYKDRIHAKKTIKAILEIGDAF